MSAFIRRTTLIPRSTGRPEACYKPQVEVLEQRTLLTTTVIDFEDLPHAAEDYYQVISRGEVNEYLSTKDVQTDYSFNHRSFGVAVITEQGNNYLAFDMGNADQSLHTLTLRFSTPLSSFHFTRSAILSSNPYNWSCTDPSITVRPEWTATAYHSQGSESVGEGQLESSFIPAATYTLSGAGITAVEFRRHNRASDSQGILNLDTLVLTAVVAPPSVESVVVNDGSAQRSMVTSFTVTFSGPVTLDFGAFELRRQDGSLVGLRVALSLVNGKTVAALTFTGLDVFGGSLADGRYRLTVRADRVRDALGQGLTSDRVDAFFRFFGDSDGDGDVDNLDFLRFRSSLNKHLGDPAYLWYFDADGDGDVDGLDVAEFGKRRGRKLGP